MNSDQRGYAYLYLLFSIALLAVTAVGMGSLEHLARTRQEERELIRIGHEFRAALLSYRRANPVRQFPLALEDLLEDTRNGPMRRHLRKMYVDPVARTSEWGLFRQANQIIGVYSLAERKPLKQAGFDEEDSDFEGASRYSDWKFMAIDVHDDAVGNALQGAAGGAVTRP